MISRRLLSAILVLTLPLAADCGNSTTSPTTTTAPTSTATVTESFTGSLTKNGGATFAFAANAAGSVTAQVKSLSDSTMTIGLSIGNWSNSACSWAVANDSAITGTSVSGTTSGATNLCVRVYDVGKMSDAAITFAVDITHP